MSDSFYQFIYTLLPCLVGAFAVAVFLTTRPISAGRAWLLGVVIAATLTFGTAMVNRPRYGFLWAGAPLYLRLFGLFGSLYFISMIVLLPAALALRARSVSRNIGIVVLIALFLASAWAARLLAMHLDVVEAIQ